MYNYVFSPFKKTDIGELHLASSGVMVVSLILMEYILLHLNTNIITLRSATRYRIAGFEAFIFREQPILAKNNFTNGDAESRLLHIIFEDWLCSHENREIIINASKITRYTV